jgi:hypothetical protein
MRALVVVMIAAGCSPPPEGIASSRPASTTVKVDFFHRPLLEIPLPNDIATRFDATSPTLRRINASMICRPGSSGACARSSTSSTGGASTSRS